MSYLVVLVAVLTRFLPHVPNFSPVFGALLFGGAYLKRRDSVWFPVALLAAGDAMLTYGFYHMKLDWSESLQCLGFAVIALIGNWLRTRISLHTVVAASFAGPTAFFVISNFGVWLGWRMYPASWAGLVACYVAALPFFRNSVVSSILFSGVLFGAYEFYRRKLGRPQFHSPAPRVG